MRNVKHYGGAFDLEKSLHRLEEIELQLGKPESWDEPDKLTPILQEKNIIESEKASIEAVQALEHNVEEWLILADEETTQEVLEQLAIAITTLQEELKKVEMEFLLAAEEDSLSAILEIHPGAGGTEAQDWAAMLLRMYTRWADSHSFTTEILDYLSGDEAGIKNATIKINGFNAYGLLKSEAGIHRLIRISPFDSSGRRHTSFSSVDVLPDAGKNVDIQINESDLRIDVFRASGAGGQHVNKTNSAVRITHIPTGIVVQCQNEKSQHSNRDTAMSILRSRLYEQELRREADKRQAQYNDKDAINFGSQIRTYTMQPYRLVKDHRTNTEHSDVNAVLDGALDKFIYDLLLYNHERKNTPAS